MKQNPCSSTLAAGALAGTVGTAVMMAMRSFDAEYAPATIPPMPKDPGALVLNQTAVAAGISTVPEPIQSVASRSLSFGYGGAAGIIYAMIRGRRRSISTLLDGGLLGMGLYVFAYAGWLPLVGLTKPAWKQRFPEIAGEALRHVVFGVATAAVYGAINAWRD
jgi:uncharacterized membrane protein YagU involved in acid resistance